MKLPYSSTKFALLGIAFFVALFSAFFPTPTLPAYAEGEPSVAVITATVDLPSSATTFSVPVVFTTTTYEISSVSFELDYDQSCVRIANAADVAS